MTTKHLNLDIKAADGGKFDAVLSTASIDRDGEVVDPFAFAPLPDYIPIDIDHAMSVEKTVGSGVPYYDEAGILRLRDLSFASTPLGQVVKTLVDERHIRSVSVAYGASRYEVDEKDGLPHLRSAELYNAAVVAIPANRDALILAGKAAKMEAPTIDAPTGDVATDTEDDAAAAAEKAAAAVVPRPVGFYKAVADSFAVVALAD